MNLIVIIISCVVLKNQQECVIGHKMKIIILIGKLDEVQQHHLRTGPKRDHTLGLPSGHYIFLESSFPAVKG